MMFIRTKDPETASKLRQEAFEEMPKQYDWFVFLNKENADSGLDLTKFGNKIMLSNAQFG